MLLRITHTKAALSETMGEGWRELDIANPTEEHAMLREMVRSFVCDEVEPQALEHDRDEKFNSKLFRRLVSRGFSESPFLSSTVVEEWTLLRWPSSMRRFPTPTPDSV